MGRPVCRAACAGATKEGPLVAAGPEEEVTEPRGRAKPKGGRGGPGLCWGHPWLAGEQLGRSRGVGGRWDSSGGQWLSQGAQHRL